MAFIEASGDAAPEWEGVRTVDDLTVFREKLRMMAVAALDATTLLYIVVVVCDAPEGLTVGLSSTTMSLKFPHYKN